MTYIADLRWPVACPTCGAKPAYPCRALTTGRVTDTHTARLAATAYRDTDGERA